MSNVSAAPAAGGGKVGHMTAHSTSAGRVRTGGPREDGPKILEHLMGWTLVVVLAMLVTQLGLL
ncbi:hypothetical protein GCM10010378_16230 [Streptomyces viridochromogenes]